MFVQSLAPQSQRLQSFVRSIMLMEIPPISTVPSFALSVPAGDNTSILLPLRDCERYVVTPSAGDSAALRKAHLHGQLTQTNGSTIEASSRSHFIALFGIIFTPLGLQRFIHRELGGMIVIQNHFVEARNLLRNIEFLNEELEEMYARFHRGISPIGHTEYASPQQFQALAQCAEQFLLRHLQTTTIPQSNTHIRSLQKAAYICERMRETQGKASIHGIAQELGLSERHSLRIMQEYVGIAGKTFGEIQRYLHASRMLLKAAPQLALEGSINTELLHSVIHNAGYYDQSHCIRDFKRFAGATPLQFLRERHALAEKLIGGEKE